MTRRRADPWAAVLASLWDWGSRELPLREWLTAAKPGERLVVLCDTPAEKGNVQSRVNRIVKTSTIKASACRTADGVVVERQ